MKYFFANVTEINVPKNLLVRVVASFKFVHGPINAAWQRRSSKDGSLSCVGCNQSHDGKRGLKCASCADLQKRHNRASLARKKAKAAAL